nr:hypothetical protein [Variovorax sp. PBS-H4]
MNIGKGEAYNLSGVLGCLAIEAHQRTDECRQALVHLARASDLTVRATGFGQHSFKFAQISRCQRLVAAQIVQR